METIENHPYADVVVVVDGKRFVGCSFVRSILVFTGGESPVFDNSPIEADCAWDFEQGAAGRTLRLLRWVVGADPTFVDILHPRAVVLGDAPAKA